MRNSKIELFSFVFLVLALSSFAQNKEVRVDLSNPRAAVYTHLYFLQKDSYKPWKSAKTIYSLKGKKAEDCAIKLKQIFDGKGLRVDISQIPVDKNYLDTINGIDTKNRYVIFPNQLPEIYVEKINNSWYYSSETVAHVDLLYNQVYPTGTEQLKTVIPKFGY